MGIPPLVWCQRVLWLALPFVASAALSDPLADHSRSVRLTVVVGGWALWGVVMVASLIPSPLTLTLVRTVSPLSVVLAAWATLRSPGAVAAAMLAVAVAAAALSLSGWVSDTFVDGGSYGDERRFALRVPVEFWAGPIPVFWSLCAGALVGGALLVAAGRPLLGGAVLVAGLALTRRAAPAFHALSRRWLVMVPAGLTLVDHHALADPVLFPRAAIVAVAPALVGTRATDLSGPAPGLALEITLSRPIEAALTTDDDPHSDATLTTVSAVLVTPARAGAVLAELSARGIATASDSG